MIDSSVLNAWSKDDADAAWSFPSSCHGDGVPSGPGAHPIIPFNRTKQPLARVRHLVSWPLSYLARAIGAPFGPRFFAAAKRSYGLDTHDHLGWDAVLLHITLICCAILVVALAATEVGRPDLRLSPTRVLAHDLAVQEAL